MLSNISKTHNVSIEKLLDASSSISNPDIIFPGQIVTIPDSDRDRDGKGKNFTVTAYTAGYESTGKQRGDPSYGITASGTHVKEGQTIACSSLLSIGTKVYIPYFDDTFTCEDRGSAITKGKLDVYMRDVEEALQFGVKELRVQIVD